MFFKCISFSDVEAKKITRCAMENLLWKSDAKSSVKFIVDIKHEKKN